MGLKYTGKKYHLLLRNCNHFADEFVHKLTGKHIPAWINRLAHMAVSVRWLIPVCLLPDVSTITLYVIVTALLRKSFLSLRGIEPRSTHSHTHTTTDKRISLTDFFCIRFQLLPLFRCLQLQRAV